jgi:hypothetical protein
MAGRQGGGREINECHSKRKENQSWRMLPGDQRRVTSEIDNEITCDYKLYPFPPISVTCSKSYIRKAPFALGAQPLDVSLLSRCWLT